MAASKTLMLLAMVAGLAATCHAACTDEATALLSACPDVQGQASELGPSIATATEAQIQNAIKNNKTPPSAGCCAASKTFFAGGCSCDPTVLTLSKAYNLDAQGFYTLYMVTIAACGSSGFSYSSKCPTHPVGGGTAPAPAPVATAG